MSTIDPINNPSGISSDDELLEAIKTASAATSTKPADSTQELTGIQQLQNMLSGGGDNQANTAFSKLATSLGTDPYSLLAIIKDGGSNSIAKMMQAQSLNEFANQATSDDPLLDDTSSSNADPFSSYIENLGSTGNQFDGLA